MAERTEMFTQQENGRNSVRFPFNSQDKKTVISVRLFEMISQCDINVKLIRERQ